ncbi:hypothetical protein G7085_08420 [Tessaracoccus sp. HDW20]|uniref:ABC transporter permease subunit n=1 Tax=Tessaracoccus coleopterorum TaxID=2714950 RepID=UPI001E64602F|nr:ABC transporter permease subunit [Tessaracoccus coleopterorum]NHB84623.1 hypothetical protein [Tessaracoccus coleopterorum]
MTLPLTLIAFAISVVLASLLGYVAAVRSETRLGTAVSGIAQVGIAVPVFWIGILLVWILALELRLFPPEASPARTGPTPPTRCAPCSCLC